MKFVTLTLLFVYFVNLSLVLSKRLKEKEEKRISRQTPTILKEFQINEMNNNSILSVVKNVTFNLNVQAKPSTGYDLYLKNFDSLDKNTIKFENLLFDNSTKLYMSSVFIPEKTNGTVKVGAPGHYQFQITTVGNFSNADIEFVKIRPWEPKNFTGLTKIRLTSTKLSEFSMKLNSNGSNYKLSLIYFLALMFVFML